MLHSQPSREYSPTAAITAAIEYTISQDFAAGHTAEQARRLQGFLGDDNGNLTQISQTTAGNHSLKDYQMQLMLLEQQNKERLLMARQQQEAIDGTEESAQARREEIELSRKRRKLDITANDMDENQTFTSATMEQVMGGLDQTSHYDALSCHFRTLYKVDCTSQYIHEYHHSADLFEDEPFADPPTHGGKEHQKKTQTIEYVGDFHIQGRAPIYDLGKYVEEIPDLAFIVLRRCKCPSRTAIQDEEIYIISSTLRSALYAVAQCYISILPQAMPQSKCIGVKERAIPFPLAEEQVLQDPYPHMYHHRLPLQRYVAENPDASVHVNSLLAYTYRLYGNSYREADRLFRERLVTREHELTLYRPNDIVVTFDEDLGELVAYVVRRWAVLEDAGNFTLDCWHWQIDGVGLARKQRQWVIPRIPEDTLCEIERLKMVPLGYINSDVSMKLALRGKKHWSLRNPSYILYKGWNKLKDQFYVN